MWALGSLYKFYSVGTGVELPRLTNQDLSLNFQASYNDWPRLDYYGEGPASLKSNRSDYRREDTLFGVSLTSPILSSIQPTCGIQQDLINIGPGTNDAVTPTNIKFGPAQAPGINMESNYLNAGCVLPIDFRDNPGYPHKGSAFAVGYRRSYAEDHPEFSFHRVSVGASITSHSLTRSA